jgi:O-methyltransferase
LTTLQRRYLELLRKSLVNELYIENDARFLYIMGAAHNGQGIDTEVLRNIAVRRPEMMAKLVAEREQGRPWWRVMGRRPDGSQELVNVRNACEFTHSMIGARRMANIEECLDRVREDGVPGDLAETGVWRGGATVFMRGYLAAHEMEDRLVWAADSFEGLPKSTAAPDRGLDFSAAAEPVLAVPLEEVQALFARYGLLDERVRFLKGWFRDTLPAAPIARLALLRLDGDLYESTRDALQALYAKLSPGGFLLVDDYGDFPPCRKAVDEFRAENGIDAPVVEVDWSGVYWRKPFA